MYRPLLIVALLAATSTAGAQKAYVAPTNETVFSETDERQGDPPVHTIWVINRSTVPVVVWSWSLVRCENVKPNCSTKPSNIKVRPNGRSMIVRVQPERSDRGMAYAFGFSWRADSAGTAALSAMADAGDSKARNTMDARRRADSIDRAQTGPRFRELTRDDFRTLAGRAVSLRSYPDTLVIKPGTEVPIEDVRVLVVDSAGNVLGRTGWVRWQTPGSGVAVFSPVTSRIAGRVPGRSVIRYQLADEAQQLLAQEVPLLEVPIVVRHTVVPDAPVFAGRVVDAETQKPLACVRLALEDSANNLVVRGRSGLDGSFTLGAPIPGTYVVRADAHGWAAVRGEPTFGATGERKDAVHAVSFTDQMLMGRNLVMMAELEQPRPVSMRTPSMSSSRSGAAPIVQAITLGGSDAMPILGIVTARVPASTMWFQMTVDSPGATIAESLMLPKEAPPAATQAVSTALQRMRFAPAKEGGRPVCELMRMQVNFSPR